MVPVVKKINCKNLTDIHNNMQSDYQWLDCNKRKIK